MATYLSISLYILLSILHGICYAHNIPTSHWEFDTTFIAKTSGIDIQFTMHIPTVTLNRIKHQYHQQLHEQSFVDEFHDFLKDKITITINDQSVKIQLNDQHVRSDFIPHGKYTHTLTSHFYIPIPAKRADIVFTNNAYMHVQSQSHYQFIEKKSAAFGQIDYSSKESSNDDARQVLFIYIKTLGESDNIKEKTIFSFPFGQVLATFGVILLFITFWNKIREK